MTDILEPMPFQNGVTAPNRVVLAPMTNYQSHADGTLGRDELNWLLSRAQGGYGIITTCATYVSPDGKAYEGGLGIDNDGQLTGLRCLADAIRQRGALSFVQLFHGGSRSPETVLGQSPWSASDDRSSGVRAGTQNDIEAVIESFAAAAARAEAAGMDGVEIHGAHGYLLTQFLSLTQNRRTDEWGGRLENRARLMRRVMQEIRSRVSSTFVVGMRLSPESSRSAVGIDLDESLQVAAWLCDDGVDFVHLSLWDVTQNTDKRPDSHPVRLFKEVVDPEVRLFAAGKIWTADEARAVIAMGADAVALGKSAILNPDWPQRSSDPSFQPRMPPLGRSGYNALGLSNRFVDGLREWYPQYVSPD